MAKTQERPMSAPAASDKETLRDYTAVLQLNLESLFDHAHDHTVRSSAPLATDGRQGDMWPVDDGSGAVKLYFKTKSGWFYVTGTPA
jgi:hypothetical protein